MSSLRLHHLVYHSSATTPMSEQELADLLAQSRHWNTAHHLTGLLLYSHGNIMQVLEGPEHEVEYIFSRIRLDQRHQNVLKLADGPISFRNFSQWSMGFKVVDPAAFQQLTGYRNLTSSSYLSTYSENENESLHALLTSFVTEDEIRL
ncbi:hypothetical protein HNQ93_001323 [Hymenobacter luteus]|uniref:BLUF domain-containing protein n=2 Tax=Hymenobacter TaxID=89966 RepID=A0A7W9WCA5_9BACT|nr:MULTISPECIES: BLUF domain-containing protein [Hymenobacter]MBB4601316.1 hypothetical protein [Hymenobacter latericoloratus]MBB6058477.1 hypothetical protein [Hymenobacter luteus]